MFKINILVSILLAINLLNGCATIPIPGPAPEGFYDKDVLKGQVGEHKKSLLKTIGVPAYILNIDENTYWIYEARSHAVGIGILVIPIIPANRSDGEFHCLLLEFDRDNNLKRYETKTETLIEYIPLDYGCACTFFPKRYSEWDGRDWVCTANRMQYDPSAQKEIEFLQAN